MGKKLYIGIDLGGTNIAAGLVNEEGKVLGKVSIPTNAELGEKAVVEAIHKSCDLLEKETGFDRSELKSIGIGVPGMMDPNTRVVIFCPNLPIEHVDIATGLSEKWGVPVHLNNDANCAALGEAYAGGAKDTDTAIFITLGTGVGGGIIINKKIYSGFNGAAGEVGHIVINLDGRQCGCGRKGCWEAYASATGLIKSTREYMQEHPETLMWELVEGDLAKVSGRTAFDAAKKGDEGGKIVVDQYIKYVAAGVIDLINIFQPEVMCIGGGISNEGDYLLKPLQKLVDEARYTRDVPQTIIKRAELGNDAGIVGAAMLGV
ncbi:MAG: ROK family protein [Eubacteriales bacterium]|jgi:glucokinase